MKHLRNISRRANSDLTPTRTHTRSHCRSMWSHSTSVLLLFTQHSHHIRLCPLDTEITHRVLTSSHSLMPSIIIASTGSDLEVTCTCIRLISEYIQQGKTVQTALSILQVWPNQKQQHQEGSLTSERRKSHFRSGRDLVKKKCA